MNYELLIKLTSINIKYDTQTILFELFIKKNIYWVASNSSIRIGPKKAFLTKGQNQLGIWQSIMSVGIDYWGNEQKSKKVWIVQSKQSMFPRLVW